MPETKKWQQIISLSDGKGGCRPSVPLFRARIPTMHIDIDYRRLEHPSEVV